ncbi:MAG: hypothetical protein VX951_01165, partial [Planctomycetota bacterium]|nr:hypothetical protein [Planctomycetota bacterium]
RQRIPWFLTACACVISARHGTSQGTDQRAGYLQMFGASGPRTMRPAELSGGAAPVLGQASSLGVVAPGYDLAALYIATKASSGFVLPLSSPLVIYLDPASIVSSIPMALRGGSSQLRFTLPRAPSLLGLDVPMQAVVYSTASSGLVGTTGLLTANLGSSAVAGTMVVDFPFEGTAGLGNPNGPGGWLRGWGGGHQLGEPFTFKNPFDNNVRVCISGKVSGIRGACARPLVIHSGGPGRTGVTLGQIPAVAGTFGPICFCLPRGGSMFVHNPNPDCLVTVRIDRIEFVGPCR